MSSDYLYDVEDNEETVVLLSMRVGGFAELTTIKKDETGIEGGIVSFCLTPDEKGWANAEKIANALNDWIQHTKNIT